MHRCKHCGEQFEGNFCPECGKPFVEETSEPTLKICPNCGEEVGAKAKFCSNCGCRIGDIEEITKSATKSDKRKSEFFIDNGKLVQYEGEDSILVIPDGVIEIGASAFEGRTSFTTVKFPDGVKIIGEKAFAGCTSIVDITIPEGLTEICKEAFNGCTSLSEINLPDSLEKIGEAAFAYCPAVESISVSEGNEIFRAVFNCLISGNELILGCQNSIIPRNIKFIDDSAFAGCINLTEIALPDNLKIIYGSAFRDCSNLTNIVLPNGLESICNYAFDGCGVTRVKLPDSLRYMGTNAFDESIEFLTMDKDVIQSCKLTKITIPDGVTGINDNAFEDCDGLISITIPDSVTSIGNRAFYNCNNIENIYFMGDIVSWLNINDLTSIMCNGKSSKRLYFNRVMAEGNLRIPDGVTTIGSYAFYSCKDLKSITIPDSVTAIGHCAFGGGNCNSNIRDINFDGTKAQWKAIKKDTRKYYTEVKKNLFKKTYEYVRDDGYSWDGGIWSVYIYCTDGTLSKDEARENS